MTKIADPLQDARKLAFALKAEFQRQARVDLLLSIQAEFEAKANENTDERNAWYGGVWWAVDRIGDRLDALGHKESDT